jgi:hypothetical protein
MMVVMSEPVHEAILRELRPFLRGETSVIELTLAFRHATNEIAERRPLHGCEVDLFVVLEEWESAGWAVRPKVVDRLRSLAARIVASDGPSTGR